METGGCDLEGMKISLSDGVRMLWFCEKIKVEVDILSP